MKQLILLSLLILTCCFSTFSQAGSVCPKIGISGPVDLYKSGQPMNFSVLVNGRLENLNVGYKWTISAGEIVKGQGTTAIEIDTTALPSQTIIATVEITGLPESCINKYSKTGDIVLQNIIYGDPIDSYGKISSWFSERNKLDNMMLTLHNDPESNGFIEFDIPTSEMKFAKTRIKKILKYFQTNGISRKRILYKIRMSSIYHTTLWNVPKGTKLPGEN